MPTYTTRNLSPDDVETLVQLELEIFVAQAAGGSSFSFDLLRLCCHEYGETSFLLLADDKPVGYLLCFVRDREAHCSALALHPDHEGAGTVPLLRALLRAIAGRVESCWITVLDRRRRTRPALDQLRRRFATITDRRLLDEFT